MVESITNLRDARNLVDIKSAKTETIRNLDRSLLKVDFGRNYRDEEWAYSTANPEFMRLVDSYRIQGWIPGSYLTVHDDGDGKFDLLRGHCRNAASEIVGISKLPCIILSGLTTEQKLMVVFEEKGADIGPIGEFKAIKAMVGLGFSRQAIAEKLGWKTKKGKWATTKVQGYVELVSLSSEIQEEWKKQQRDPQDKTLTLPPLALATEIRHLYTEMVKDRDAGFVTDGPAFTKALEEYKEAGPKGKKKGKSAFTGSALKGLGDMATNAMFKKFLYHIAGVEGYEYGSLHSVIDTALNVVHPNLKPENPPATVEQIFGSVPPVDVTTSSEEPKVPTVVISEGKVSKVKSR